MRIVHSLNISITFLIFICIVSKLVSDKLVHGEKLESLYTIGDEIGKGGFGMIFSATQKFDNKLVYIDIWYFCKLFFI